MRPQDLVQVQETVVATMAALKGDFDKEIAALKLATAEWDKRAKLAEEEKRIAQQRIDIENGAKKVAYEVQQHELRLQGLQDALVERENKMKAREAAVVQRETNLAQAQATFDREREEQQKGVTVMMADIALKQKAAQELLDSLNARESGVAARESKVKQAMAVARTLVQ